MVNQRVQMKGVGWFVGLVVPLHEICVLPCYTAQLKIFFSSLQYFSHRPAIWAGSQAGSPVFWYVSLTLILRKYFSKGRWVQQAWATNSVSTLSDAESLGSKKQWKRDKRRI
jgi:hypothetical protein